MSTRYVNHAAKCATCLAASSPSQICSIGLNILAERVASFPLKGKRWKVQKVWRIDPGLQGLCDYETRTISYVESMDSAGTLDTLIHELLHAHAPDWSEKRVASTAGAMVAVLRRAGLA